MAAVELRLIHQSPQSGPLPAGAILWRTCLREVAFVGSTHTPSSPAVLKDVDAYTLLLEIVAGLRSPLIGETEVQAQFKAFLAALDPDRHGHLQRLGQRVLADVKTIRARHLQGLGAHSYASLAAAHLVTGSRLVILGTGAMASTLIETIGASHPIHQWGRRLESGAVSAEHHRLFLYEDAQAIRASQIEAGPVSIVVAAPVAASPLADVLAVYDRIVSAVDLRPSDARAQAPLPGPIVTLDDLFREAGSTPGAHTDRIAAAHTQIRELARAFASRQELRPFGWDDLCA